MGVKDRLAISVRGPGWQGEGVGDPNQSTVGESGRWAAWAPGALRIVCAQLEAVVSRNPKLKLSKNSFETHVKNGHWPPCIQDTQRLCDQDRCPKAT